MNNGPLVKAACAAMGTRFEIALWGGPEGHLRAAAAEALDEVMRLDGQLSAFDPRSDISDINARAADEAVRIEPRLLRLIERCREFTELTAGAFDITIGPLMTAWGFRGDGAPPSDEQMEDARACVGMHLIETDLEAMTVRFARAGVMLDLGAVAKGHALDQAAEILRECGIGGALLHGGTSTIVGIGADLNGKPWRVGIKDPSDDNAPLDVVELLDTSLSVSAPHGRMTGTEGAVGHVMDPRTGRPATGLRLAAVACANAAEADALSSALLVLGPAFVPDLEARGARCWVA